MTGQSASIFSKERIVAPEGFNRWLVPPAALAVHLCIGQVYAFSVFNEPLTRVVGITAPAPEDWKLTTVGWIFSLANLIPGLATAAFAGKWVDRVGPRKPMFIAACCFGGGFLISALGVWLHQIWLLYVGYGVLGGIGLGLGYVAPVATLIRWFPDRRGMATGLAIMGFGGGAMIGAPLAAELMGTFRDSTSVGVTETFLVMGVIYFLSMVIGSLAIRLPPPDWKPEGWVPHTTVRKMVTRHHVHADQALKTPQFWLLWLMLCLYVVTGIGVIGQASLMIQEMFKGVITAAAAAGFVGLLSLFNMGGRFLWSSASDYLGRRRTYFVFTLLGAALYATVPYTAEIGSVVLFVVCFALILSMYGGAFAAIPAYIADVFGTLHVGGIHGRILTAWSAAGLLGPALVNYAREYKIARGVAKADAYDFTLYVMAGILLVAFVCNLLMRPVHEKHHLRHDEVDEDLAEHEEAEEDVDLTSAEEPALAGGPAAGGGVWRNQSPN